MQNLNYAILKFPNFVLEVSYNTFTYIRGLKSLFYNFTSSQRVWNWLVERFSLTLNTPNPRAYSTLIGQMTQSVVIGRFCFLSTWYPVIRTVKIALISLYQFQCIKVDSQHCKLSSRHVHNKNKHHRLAWSMQIWCKEKINAKTMQICYIVTYACNRKWNWYYWRLVSAIQNRIWKSVMGHFWFTIKNVMNLKFNSC